MGAGTTQTQPHLNLTWQKLGLTTPTQTRCQIYLSSYLPDFVGVPPGCLDIMCAGLFCPGRQVSYTWRQVILLD